MWWVLGLLVVLTGVIVRSARRPDLRVVRTVAVVVAGGVGLCLVAFVGLGICVNTPRSGADVAAERAEAAVTAVADQIVVAQPTGDEALDGEQLALSTVRRAAEYEYGLGVQEAGDLEVVVLGWSGTTADAGGATVDVRVEAHVPGETGSLLGRSLSQGRAVRCWRLVARDRTDAESAGIETIDCPATPVDQAPVPAGAPTLGPDARATVLRVLREAPTPDTDSSPVDTERLVEDVQTAWWHQSSVEGLDGYGVEVHAQLEEDALVLAVGIPGRRECVIGVRETGSAPVLYAGAPDDELAPGGSGCRPTLFRQGLLTPAPTPEPGPTASPTPSRPWLLAEATTPENEKLLLRTLGDLPSGADTEAARRAVAEAFPDYTTDALRRDDELVATVSGPTHRSCLVAVRAGDRDPVRFTEFPRISLEPGEIGCRPSLYRTGVTAH